MTKYKLPLFDFFRLPPCGGSGLKSRNGFFRMEKLSLPPCGGSGLKSLHTVKIVPNSVVSLRVEGVD